MNVKFVDLRAQYILIKDEIDRVIHNVIECTSFSGGPFVQSFEEQFAAAHDANYCVGVNSGTSALHVALWALGIGRGDEVVVPTNTFFATAQAVNLTGASPVFVDCEPEYFNLNPDALAKSITHRTKAIIAVNLYGQPARLDLIREIADRNSLYLVEDCAQSHLAEFNGIKTGNFGICGCFSFYPGKNLGAYGEGGAVITNDEGLAKKMAALRNHGAVSKYNHEFIGHNYRMEGIQAAVLDVKLKYLPKWTEQRRENARRYRNYLGHISQVELPPEMPGAKHVYHLFVIRVPERDALSDFLIRHGVNTGIHYPIPCHLQKAYTMLGYPQGSFPFAERYANEILSLPMYAELEDVQIRFVSDRIKEFYAK